MYNIQDDGMDITYILFRDEKCLDAITQQPINVDYYTPEPVGELCGEVVFRGYTKIK